MTRQGRSAAEKRRRWKTAIHEGGHAVAGAILNGGCELTGAVVLEAGGLAFIDAPDPLGSFEQALAVAAGPAAEALSERYAPPRSRPRPSAVVSGDAPSRQSCHAALTADLRAAVTDAVRLARWCCESCPDEPERWVSRRYWVQREAEILVRRNAGRIVRAAEILYRSGVLMPRQLKEIIHDD